MTDDEALSILSERESLGNYVAMADDEKGIEKPYFRKGSIVLRGDFFPHELEAILHFAPKDATALNDARDAARYRWLRDDNAYAPEEAMVHGGVELDELCDDGIMRAANADG